MGMNAAARLKSEGLNVSKRDQLVASVHDIYFPPKEGHVLSPVWHPRGELTIDDPGIKRLVDEIVADGEIREAALVREDNIRDGADGRTGAKVKVLTIVDGAGRTVAGRLAEPILQKAGKCKDGLTIKIKLFDKPGDLALLLARQRADSDPSKRPHPPSILAIMVQQMMREGAKVSDIMPVMPRWVTERDLEGFTRFHLLDAEVVRMIDTGEAAPNLFRAVIDEPRAEQAAALKHLVDSGVTHMKGATLLKNKETRAARAASGEGKAASSDLPKQGEPVMKDRRPHPKTMRKVLANISHKDNLFALGLRYALGEDIRKDVHGALLSAIMTAEGEDK